MNKPTKGRKCLAIGAIAPETGDCCASRAICPEVSRKSTHRAYPGRAILWCRVLFPAYRHREAWQDVEVRCRYASRSLPRCQRAGFRQAGNRLCLQGLLMRFPSTQWVMDYGVTLKPLALNRAPISS